MLGPSEDSSQGDPDVLGNQPAGLLSYSGEEPWEALAEPYVRMGGGKKVNGNTFLISSSCQPS